MATQVLFYKKSKADYEKLGTGYVVGAIYFVEDENTGLIYLNGKCYGSVGISDTVVKSVEITEEAGEHNGDLKITDTAGTIKYVALPDGAVYTAGEGITISNDNVISASDETLDADLTVTGVEVGNLTDGKTITKGTSIQDLLKQMLTKEIDCTVASNPKVTLTGVTSATKVVGEEVTGTLGYNFTDGSFKKPDGSTVAAGCVASNPVYTGSLPLTVALGANSFKVVVDYAASTADLKTNLGNTSSVKINAGSATSSTVTINGTYPFFATTVDADTLTQQSLKVWNATAGQMSTGNMKLVASKPDAPRKFSLPRKATSMTQLNTLSGKMESVALSAYTETTETRTYGDTDVTYYTYAYTGAAEGSVTVDVKF